MPSNRRNFLKQTVGSSALVSLTPTLPYFLSQLGAQAAQERRHGDRVLVVVQLAGGNDGLNTVVPFGDDAYQRNRFTLRLGNGQVHKLDDYHALHPAMEGMKGLFDDGKLSVLQGIGYANPNRSHFESMDFWQTANREANRRTTGWLGRYLDASAGGAGGGGDVGALHLGGDRQPLALVGNAVHAASIRAIDAFKLRVDNDPRLRETIRQSADTRRADAGGDLVHFLQRSTAAALTSSERVQAALSSYKTSVNYPGFQLARQLKTVAQLIDAGMSTRVYYLSLNGFDTHANQQAAHAALLRELSQSVTAFTRDIAEHDHGDRVMLMTFSEFGRRVKENASRGTDHGTAAPMFLAGGRARSGIVGKHPSLTDLDQGDLKFHTDFRSVYAGVLQQWLGFESPAVLGRRFEPVRVVKS